MTKTASAGFIADEIATKRRPSELYDIYYGSTHYRYNSTDSSITYGGNVYSPATIGRDTISYDSDFNITTLDIKIAHITDPVIEYIALNPIDIVWVDVYKIFYDDLTTAVVTFTGEIKSVTFQGAEAVMHCVGFEYFLKQKVPYYRYQSSCNNILYDTKCTKSAASYKTTTAVTVSADGKTLTSASFGAKANTYFQYGYVVFGNYKRSIVDHTGNNIKIRFPISTLDTGESVDAYAGCDLLITTCRDKFSNMNNFFGMPFIPIENPSVRT